LTQFGLGSLAGFVTARLVGSGRKIFHGGKATAELLKNGGGYDAVNQSARDDYGVIIKEVNEEYVVDEAATMAPVLEIIRTAP
jgi:hypothetical protein